MSSSKSDGPPLAWIVVAHVIGAALIGGLDAARLHSIGIVLAVVPIAGATGLFAGVVVAGTERWAAGRAWWAGAALLALPTLLVTIPVSRSLFNGAFAQTLPGARYAPYLLPVVLWVFSALAIAGGRRLLRASDLTTRGIAVLALGGVVGGVVWAERHVLKTGYPDAHVGATLAVIVLLGIAVRVTRRASLPVAIAAAIAGLAIGTAAAAAKSGLANANDRRLLSTFGDQSRDLVRLWRGVFDLDRDGSSALLGGGDCDDLDASRHPGAIDKPGDGIDQDCDGADAVAITATPIAPPGITAQPIAPLPPGTDRMNVVLITVDALRFDPLAPEAPDREDFPTLTKLLGESVWFTHAIAPASGTDVSLSTILTGRFDPFQSVDATLVEAIRATGRRTYAAIPGEVLRYVGDTLIGRGQDKLTTVHTDWEVADVGDHVSAATTTLEGLRALDDAGARPYFIWLHYFDVHEHHQIDVPKPLLGAVHDGGSKVIHRYRALLHAIDGEVARFLDRIDLNKTIIVFASDHGEALGDDPRLLDTHGQVVYHALVRVPFAIHVPGITPGLRTDLVSLVDVAPTLLDLLGAKPPMALDGIDLVPALVDAPRTQSRAVAIHEEKQWGVVEWPYQLIVRPEDNLVELYDLEQDPGEHTDLAAAHPEIVSRLRARYAEFPQVKVDRTPNGRTFREQQAQPPHSRAPK